IFRCRRAIGRRSASDANEPTPKTATCSHTGPPTAAVTVAASVATAIGPRKNNPGVKISPTARRTETMAQATQAGMAHTLRWKANRNYPDRIMKRALLVTLLVLAPLVFAGGAAGAGSPPRVLAITFRPYLEHRIVDADRLERPEPRQGPAPQGDPRRRRFAHGARADAPPQHDVAEKGRGGRFEPDVDRSAAHARGRLHRADAARSTQEARRVPHEGQAAPLHAPSRRRPDRDSQARLLHALPEHDHRPKPD